MKVSAIRRWMCFSVLFLLPLGDLNIAFGSFFLSPPYATLLLLIGFILGAIFFNTGNRKYVFARSHVNAFFLFFLLAVAIVIPSIANRDYMNAVRIVPVIFWVPILAIAVCNDPSRGWLLPVFLASLLSALIAIGHFLGVVPLFEFERASGGAQSAYGYGYTGLLKQRGEYGILLLFGLAAVLLRLISPGRSKILSLVALSILVVASVISGSRSTWVAMFFSLAFFCGFFYIPKISGQSKNLFPVFLVVVYILIAFLALLTASEQLARIYSSMVGIRESSVSGRMDQYAYVLSNFGEFFLSGGGAESIITKFGYGIHNNFLWLYATKGFVALVFYSALIVSISFSTYRDLLTKRQSKEAYNTTLVFGSVTIGVVWEMMLYPDYTSLVSCAYFGVFFGERLRAGKCVKESSHWARSHRHNSMAYK